jgi:hypothetical protein
MKGFRELRVHLKWVIILNLLSSHNFMLFFEFSQAGLFGALLLSLTCARCTRLLAMLGLALFFCKMHQQDVVVFFWGGDVDVV